MTAATAPVAEAAAVEAIAAEAAAAANVVVIDSVNSLTDDERIAIEALMNLNASPIPQYKRSNDNRKASGNAVQQSWARRVLLR